MTTNKVHSEQPATGKLVLVAVTDIFFYSKVRDVLARLGYKGERARSQEEITAKAANLNPSALILNMNDDVMNAMQAVEDLKKSEESRHIPILAFANHEEVQTFRRAQELGVTKIVSRNEFSARTGDLVTEVLGTQAA